MIKRSPGRLALCLFSLSLVFPLRPAPTSVPKTRQKAAVAQKAAKAPKIREKDLAEKYRQFLNEISYIIKDKERDVFMRLAGDRERDAFIDMFWKIRDPTPGTPGNEYREEHLRRFREANKLFHRNSPREGWLTDMGRVFIILGEPISKERIESDNVVYPCEVWSYYGNPDIGQPSHFSLVFFQRGGSGEYKLYDPVSDGPAALLVQGRQSDPFDYENLFDEIKEKHPTLALVCLSVIPGEIPTNYQPSPQTTIIMQQILESPKKVVNESYATHFLNAKGVVSVENLSNWMDCKSTVEVIPDPVLGMFFVHFSMAPSNISVDLYEPKNQYYCNFMVDATLRRGDDIIFQYPKEYPIYIPEADIARMRRTGLAVEESFPVIEGKYTLTVLLRNPANKEFNVLNQEIEVPDFSGSVRISKPVLGLKFQDSQAAIEIPYKILDKKLVVDPNKTYAAADELAFFTVVSNSSEEVWKDGQLDVQIQGTKAQNPTRKSFTVRLSAFPYKKIMPLLQTVPLSDFSADYYDLILTLKDGQGKTMDQKRNSFAVSQEKDLPHPEAHSKGIPLTSSFLFFYMLAGQYDKIGANDKALAAYEKAYVLNPAAVSQIPEYARFLLKVKNYDKVLAVIEGIKNEEKLKFNYFLLKGKALMGQTKYGDAVGSFLQGNQIYNSDIGLLNDLGVCFIKTGRKEDALDSLNASLKLNPDQPGIVSLVKDLEKK